MRLTTITVDSVDPVAQADWWAAALDYERVGPSSCRAAGGSGPVIEFVPVPEPKVVKNRVHLGCIAADDLDAELDRLEGLGATVAWEEVFPEAWQYRNVVLRDPEGNEFCLGSGGATPDVEVTELRMP